MTIVLDTNVVVSGLLNPFGAPGRILDLVLSGDIQLVYDDRILAEYAEVLARKRFNFDPDFVRIFLDYIRLNGQLTTAIPLQNKSDQLIDPDDLPFMEVAATSEETVMVTSNLKHFGLLIEMGVEVQSPSAYLQNWTTGT